MTSPGTLSQDVRRPISVMWPIRDDNPIPLWLVPGDWTRGRALAYVAHEEGEPFVSFRAHRLWLRWMHLSRGLAGWELDDGTLTPCARSDDDAEPYWQVTQVRDHEGRGGDA